MQRPHPSVKEDTDVWVSSGSASGRTRLTAFDAALADAGIHNANLVRVSSITPARAARHTIDEARAMSDRITPGMLLPAVYARTDSDVTDERIHAAVAGVRLEDGYGINVEHHGAQASREDVRHECETMLTEMAMTREQSLASDVWMHYEACTVPEDAEWASVVAAIVYI